MDARIKELSLLLMCLTGWEEDSRREPGEKVIRSWKGYPFEVLDQLEEESLLFQMRGTKSIILTKEGIERAKELEKKYA